MSFALERTPPKKTDSTAASLSASSSVPNLAQIVNDPNITSRHKRPRPFYDDDKELADPLRTLGLELRLLREEMQGMRKDLQEYRQEMRDFRESLGTCTQRMDTMDQRVDSIERKITDAVVTVGSKVLEEAINNLQMELHDRDQDMLANDVQISNVSEERGENPVHLVTLIAAKLGVTIDERDVVSAERVGPRGDGANDGRPRPLVLRFARRATRDALLHAARVRRGATTADLGLCSEPRRFYINERLTKLNRQLFAKAREQARAHGWRWVWTRDGRIHARRAEGQPGHRIRRECDLLNIYSGEKVGSS